MLEGFVGKLSVEQFEQLRGLRNSDSWKLYRQILIQMKDAHFHSALAESDPNKVMKTIGLVAGLNLAVNQLVVFDDAYKKIQAGVVGGEVDKPLPGIG